ncbi:GGDEF domain-containing protein [Butyrivibrio fibrisolvens]|uniref:GGDEF domain-containing protein n=1 Tax=Butyrivibrio fibrisolvens TaxID=831 RepID=UPI0009B79153|nr:GGDEF domain-containing protein [Butyrivibrio fibrisolvens]
MEGKKRRIGNRQYLVFPLVMCFVMIVLLSFGGTYIKASDSDDISCIDSGWSISRGDMFYQDVNLSEYDMDNSRSGETITITTPIYVTDYTDSIIFISTYMSVSVSVDGETVYSYGPEYEGRARFVPKNLNFITPFKSIGEHELSITYILFDDNSVISLPLIYMGSKHSLIRSFLSYHRLAIFVGAFFMVYACLLVSLGIFLALSKKRFMPVFFSAAFSMLLGFYTYSYNDIMCIASDQNMFFTMLEYISLYQMPLIISIILYSTHPEIATETQRFIIVINVIVPIIIRLLHSTDTIYMNRLVLPVQSVVLIEIVLILPQIIKGYFDNRKSKEHSEDYTGINADNYFIMGFVMFIICVLIEIIRLYVLKSSQYKRISNYTGNISFLTLGMLFFVICLFIYYFLNGTDHISTAIVRKKLEGIAYTDSLTGLSNRGTVNKYVETLEGRFVVVSFDLDRLKYVNDTFGHLEGDRMLKNFADILKSSFDNAAIIGRTGGDEFIAILEDPEDGLCDSCISNLEHAMHDFNDGDDNIKLSASIGYACSDETINGDYTDVFHLADERMYKMKEQHHAQ